ncbi:MULTISPECIES: tyrosine-type recombinase/integrase [unclassified Methylophaga]|jgi:site-specific recombinase XerD|uniref:tyrosine-type recombinase/integrase n=1 Tax=unclassified Methylophaga TaxID=2629249 RepID=UPI00259D1A88|nr:MULTISPECIES: tyrosine-type recombinase/integrase [unclassified Methylophaga]|tara:strand:+ start:42508 stop:43620 length:1113 start_codon:yes stop_codon:yes gene_type:complete
MTPKPKTKHPELPPRMVKREWKTRKGVSVAYYYEHPRDENGKRVPEPLGTDFAKAKQRWGEIEGVKIEKYSGDTLGAIYLKYMKWAENRTLSGLSPRTIKDRKNYWTHLEPVFAHLHIDAFKPEWFLQYFESRSSQVGAKKEIKFMSVIFNWAKLRGLCTIENPITGTTRQYKVKEHRDILITHDEYKAVHAKAKPFIKDLMDLLYMSGARPDEAVSFRFEHDKGDELVYRMGKTNKIKRVQIGPDLRALINKRKKLLKACKVTMINPPILFDDKGNKLSLNGTIKYWFGKARDDAALKRRWQLKDIRPYAATERYKKEGIEATRRLLGHSTEAQTRSYIRDYLGEETESHEMQNSGIMAKVKRENGESS